MCGRVNIHEPLSFSNDMKKYYAGDIEDYLDYDDLKVKEEIIQSIPNFKHCNFDYR